MENDLYSTDAHKNEIYLLNKTPAQAFTPPAEQKNGTSGHLCIVAQAGET